MSDKITGVCVDIPTVIKEAKQSKWISVKESLPEEGVTVLVYNKGSYEYFTAEYCPTTFNDWISSFYRFNSDDITHWMPLPKPPKDI